LVHLTKADLAPADLLVGRFLDARHYDRVVCEATTVLKPNGKPLLIYVPDVFPRHLCRSVFDAFEDVPLLSENRGAASGSPRFRPVLRDGRPGRRIQARQVPSGVLGYLDRTANFPYCRRTALTRTHPQAFRAVRPFASQASRIFRELATERWEEQRTFVDSVSKGFAIRHTVFTTITVNRSWRTAGHRDAGNFRGGMGVMAVLGFGRYSGCELIFPRYRTAVDMRSGGLCLADVHQVHGNAPLVGWPGEYVRLSFVFYPRARMCECGTPDQERVRAARAAWARANLSRLPGPGWRSGGRLGHRRSRSGRDRPPARPPI
jgi:hypothetical protein